MLGWLAGWQKSQARPIWCQEGRRNQGRGQNELLGPSVQNSCIAEVRENITWSRHGDIVGPCGNSNSKHSPDWQPAHTAACSALELLKVACSAALEPWFQDLINGIRCGGSIPTMQPSSVVNCCMRLKKVPHVLGER